MLAAAIQFADENDLHFTYNVELKIFYFHKSGLMSEHIKVGDWDKYNIETKRMTSNAH
jgi:hypothetical protein